MNLLVRPRRICSLESTIAAFACRRYSSNLSTNYCDPEPFHFFKSPLAVRKSYDWQRRLMNPIYLSVYRKFIEPAYSMEGFVNGAKQTATLVATLVRESRFDALGEFMTKEAVRRVKFRANELPAESLQRYLSFRQRDIVNAFHHSSFFSSMFLLIRKLDSYEFTFHSTFVLYIDTKEPSNTKRSLKELLDDPNVLVCNLSVARRVEPVGRWRVTDINFFNPQFLNTVDKCQIITLV